ncbi:hypothetical protein HI914_04253 [Erysiphe necator]|nr:hypothetical protein HI914_04253 [Erysiphe necator]
MKYNVPSDAESISENSQETSSNIEFHETSEFLELNPSTITEKGKITYISVANMTSEIGPENAQSLVDSEELLDKMSGLRFEKSQNSGKSQNTIRITNAIENAPPEVQKYLLEVLEGQKPKLPQVPAGTATQRSESTFSPEETIKRDAKFEKWDGKSLSWTPHYYFLKAQCRVYKPLLVTDEAVCLKIYESIPEPQRQRIRGYWIRCGEDENFNWKEFLEECNVQYFDQIGADKAERKLSKMRQGESQYFRNFLQEWELQLEYAGGREWPDSTKINHLRQSVSEKIREKFPVLGLPRHDYAKWVTKITEVAANMEDSDRFIQPGEARTTQFASRSRLLSSEYLAGPSKNQREAESSISTAPQLDYEGDTTMQGMKLELQRLANAINKISVESSASKKKSYEKKPSAPWRTESEVAILREKRVCLRCLKPGHPARYCQKFGPAVKPDQSQVDSILDLASFVQDNQGVQAGKE